MLARQAAAESAFDADGVSMMAELRTERVDAAAERDATAPERCEAPAPAHVGQAQATAGVSLYERTQTCHREQGPERTCAIGDEPWHGIDDGVVERSGE